MTPPPTPEERARAFAREWWARGYEDDVVRDLLPILAAEREAGRREGLRDAARYVSDKAERAERDYGWNGEQCEVLAEGIRALAEPRIANPQAEEGDT